MPLKESPPLAGGCTRTRTGKAPGSVTRPPAGSREMGLGSFGLTSWAERPRLEAVRPTTCSKVSVRSAETPGRSRVAVTWLPEMVRLPMPWAEAEAAAMTRTERKPTRTFGMSVAPSTRTGEPHRSPGTGRPLPARLGHRAMQANSTPARLRGISLRPGRWRRSPLRRPLGENGRGPAEDFSGSPKGRRRGDHRQRPFLLPSSHKAVRRPIQDFGGVGRLGAGNSPSCNYRPTRYRGNTWQRGRTPHAGGLSCDGRGFDRRRPEAVTLAGLGGGPHMGEVLVVRGQAGGQVCGACPHRLEGRQGPARAQEIERRQGGLEGAAQGP